MSAGNFSPELVIFDCDGVLVDSEVISIDVEYELLSRAGIPISRQEVADRFVGVSVASMEKILTEEMQVKLPQGLLSEGQAETLRRFEDNLLPIPYVDATLNELTLPRCVASSSLPHRIDKSLRLTRLLKHFEPHVFSASMVQRGKPAPDLFLHAAREMGASPECCLVIEDSVAGIQAAKSAGMTVFGFTGGGHARSEVYRERLKATNPDRLFDDMRDLLRLIPTRAN